MKKAPKGNTQFQVTQSIYEYLQQANRPGPLSFLDLPCGQAEFLKFVVEQFPKSEGLGIEIKPFPEHHETNELKFKYLNLSQPFKLEKKYDVVTSISGVMEFENTALFIDSCRSHLKDDGLLFITNDNIQTLRDRFSFFCYGKLRRFPMCMTPGQPTYKSVPIQELHKILIERGFNVLKIQYTSTRLGDWLSLPVALVFYAMMAFYIAREKSTMPMKRRFELFPLKALMSRHYYLVAQPK